MACIVTFKDQCVLMNNRQFSNLICLSLEYSGSVMGEENQYVARLTEFNDKEFFPGRGMDIEEDFPEIDEQKFWSKTLFDTARAIFKRELGVHDHVYWQAQMIYVVYAVGLLFQDSVRQTEPDWCADTLDGSEFRKVYET